jgi:hypothetical protein
MEPSRHYGIKVSDPKECAHMMYPCAATTFFLVLVLEDLRVLLL